MSIHLDENHLVNTQQMEVEVNGPDGATHLVLCTGVAQLGTIHHEAYTFLVGPPLSPRQFVGVIVSGALSTIQTKGITVFSEQLHGELGVSLISIDANYDNGSGRVKVQAKVSPGLSKVNLAISYHISILAEMPRF